jgi:WD40 repeat protein
VLRGHKAVVWSVCFSSDSRWLITDASDGTIRRWCLDMEWLLNYTREAAGRELTDTERQHYGINDED